MISKFIQYYFIVVFGKNDTSKTLKNKTKSRKKETFNYSSSNLEKGDEIFI